MGSPLSPKTLRVAGQALGFTDEAGDAIRQLSRPIRAYHGSPHSFDAFDASKIGTGEGAQSYGHGLYFAGKEGTAKYYRDALSGQILVDGQPLAPASPTEHTWASLLARDRDFADAQARVVRQKVADYSERLSELQGLADRKDMRLFEQPGLLTEYGNLKYLVGSLSDDLRAYDSLSPRSVARNPGHMYEVEIDYPEEALLDWDAPLESQPQAVRDFYGSGGRRGYHGMIDGPGDGDRLWHNRKLSIGPNSAAKELFGYGIPGIRYLDRGSRAAGEGTRNFVMFPGTEDRIRILRKYGLLAPMAAGAAMEEQ